MVEELANTMVLLNLQCISVSNHHIYTLNLHDIMYQL